MKFTTVWGACLVGMVIVGGSARGDTSTPAHCGRGTFQTETSAPYLCGTNPDGSPLWGYKASCYIQFCDEDAVPAYRNPCWGYTWCPGLPVKPGACAEASAANICVVTNATCQQTCDEVCGNGIDDNGDGRID